MAFTPTKNYQEGKILNPANMTRMTDKCGDLEYSWGEKGYMTRMTDECGALEYGATLHRPDPVTLTWAEQGREASPGSHKASWLLFQILFGEGGLLMRHFRGLRQ